MKTWGLRGTRGGGLNPQPPDKSSTDNRKDHIVGMNLRVSRNSLTHNTA